ncbi:unnamed protein product (macronuclear) [Paramecium tetraurelia]|uniref:Methyltransferase type 11 domain-containing protein n=1 Tax=Paramecium tetraurelia TaxID=5888 RepID=A0ECE9_PARTE|nr:uncharacterized protein GSPATT00003835001 [Paramecium tetraurelia]CAK92966.1 unnamed protein product [Paramecium tetraurelia]|eukprot:XP_001460363.1 hypothetical protein (macronuclear) [Paramecium tetraurelia strain d4-2]
MNRQYALRSNIENIFLKQSTFTLADNLSSIRKQYDGNIAYFGQGAAQFLQNLPNNLQPKTIYLCDIDLDFLEQSLQQLNNDEQLRGKFQIQKVSEMNSQGNKTIVVPICCDEDFWPFLDGHLQLIVSNMNLHWVNDLQVVLIKWLESLEPDGTLVGSIFGSDTLQELRISFSLAENERFGGVSQHVSPFISITEMGNLLARLKFTLPTICTERNLYEFDSVYHLMQYIQDIGEGEALIQKRIGTFKETTQSVSAIYESLFKNENMKVNSTFEQIYFSAWKYHESQSKPKSRGSATVSLQQLEKEIHQIAPEDKIIYGTLTEDDIQEDLIEDKQGTKKKD